jgi:hypothetical protein
MMNDTVNLRKLLGLTPLNVVYNNFGCGRLCLRKTERSS